MALSNSTASSATNVISSETSAATSNLIQQQKTHLPNPFDLSDSQILDRVYLTHVSDDEICDTKILFDLVSDVLLQSYSSQIAQVSYKPEFSTLKLISCQMIATRNAPQCAHQTTLWILQHLRCYSWDAKALISVAAFSLEYGNFLYLHRVATSDMLGTSLRQLNQVEERKVSADITELVSLIVHVFQHIKEWATWSAKGYDYDEVPSLTEALQEIPVIVYWTIASTVAATGNIVGVSDYKISSFRERLDLVNRRLVKYLISCKTEIGYIEDNFTRRKIFDKPKDIVDLLKALIYRNGSQGAQIYEGTLHVKNGLEVLKQKNVLLFISSLDSIADEIRLLNSIYERLQENPKELKGFRKDDFKILWVPIVDEWDQDYKERLRTWRSSINWYSVEYFNHIPGLKIIKDPKGLNYVGNPIIPVFNAQGILTNKDAMELIFQWGIDAFPFREIDGNELTLKWKWLWDVIRKVAPGLGEIKGDRYMFIYGGNNKWVQDFTLELEKVKWHENTKRADVKIEYHQLGKDDPNNVSSFWIGIERNRQNKKFHQVSLDCAIQDITKTLFCLKRDPQGWAILTKGSNVKVLGHGEPMYQTLAEYQNWKDKVLEKEGFDVAFKEYYDIKAKERSLVQPCSIFNVDNYTSSVIATITCPNPTCGRVMEVTSVNYKCCHRDDHNGSFC